MVRKDTSHYVKVLYTFKMFSFTHLVKNRLKTARSVRVSHEGTPLARSEGPYEIFIYKIKLPSDLIKNTEAVKRGCALNGYKKENKSERQETMPR